MPDEAMRVELTTPGLDRSVQQIERLAAAYDRLGDAEARIGNLTGGAGGGGGAGAGSRSRVGSGPAAAGFLTGPRQQMQKVEEQIRRAQAEGNTAAHGDLLDRKMRLERSVYLNEMRRKRGVEGPGLLELFGDMNSLLGGMTGGAGRLLGQGIQLFEGGMNIEQKMGGLGGAGGAGGAAGIGRLAAVAGPAAIALGAAAAGAAVFASAVRQSAANLQAFGSAMGMSGGTAGDVAGLVAGGVDAGEIASRGARIRALRSSNPWAMQLLGYASPFEFATDQNDAAQLQRAMDKLRSLRSRPGEQLRAARILGMEDLLGRVNVSPFVQDAQNLTGRLGGRVNDPASLQAGKDLTEMQRLMGEQWKMLTTELGKPGVKLFTEALRDLQFTMLVNEKILARIGGQFEATFGRGATGTVERINEVLSSTLAGSVAGPLGAVYGLIKGLLGQGEKPEDVQQKQLDELQKLNRQVDAGIHGGGAAAAGALPAHLRGWYLEEAGRGRYRRYGSIGI